MFTLVIGGSKSGKSGFAEGLMEQFNGRKFYVATMMPFGEEVGKAIERHRKMREGKGFETIEKYTSVGEIAGSYDLSDSSVLIECMGNLCANEMFSKYDEGDESHKSSENDEVIKCENVCDEGIGNENIDNSNIDSDDIDSSNITDEIVKDIKLLVTHAKNLIIVSNIVGEDGREYSEETLRYIRNLGIIHEKLTDIADNVVEMVYGIPVVLKESGNFADMIQSMTH